MSTKPTKSTLDDKAFGRFLYRTEVIALQLGFLEDQITCDRLHLFDTKMAPELKALRKRLDKIVRLAKECPF